MIPVETGFYYLQSRYYDPESCRFLSADEPSMLGLSATNSIGANLFNYCYNNVLMFCDPEGKLAVSSIGAIVNGLAHLAGFNWDRNQGVWYSRQDAKQRNFGYCDLYDIMAPLAGMCINHKKIAFNYGRKSWMIWLWKGLYGITTGSEIGVYIYDKTISVSYLGKTLSQKWYRCANDNERLKMSLTLYRNGKKLYSRSDYTWWLTGFKPGMSFWWDTLKMDISITFPNNDMANAFRKSYGLKTSSSCTVNFRW